MIVTEEKIPLLHWNCGYFIYISYNKLQQFQNMSFQAVGPAKPRSQKEGEKGMTEIKYISSGIWAGSYVYRPLTDWKLI